MFIWFTFRDCAGNPWQSGLVAQSGTPKPAFASFGALARLTDGSTIAAKAGAPVHVTMFVPYLAHYSQPGASIGMTYIATNAQGKTVDDRSADRDPRSRPVGHVHADVHPRQGSDVHRGRDAERGERAQPVAHRVRHGHLSL